VNITFTALNSIATTPPYKATQTFSLFVSP
jgi:hypothetical protein